MHPAIIIGTVRSLIVDVAMGQIPRSTERISSFIYFARSASSVTPSEKSSINTTEFQLIPTSMTLSDLERRNGIAFFSPSSIALRANRACK